MTVDIKMPNIGENTYFNWINTGRKDDSSKPRLDLVLGDFALALTEVGKVGTIGANKYSDSNWLKVDNGKERYANAMLRHYLESKQSPLDSESGKLHLAHMAWNALAVLELTLREGVVDATTN